MILMIASMIKKMMIYTLKFKMIPMQKNLLMNKYPHICLYHLIQINMHHQDILNLQSSVMMNCVSM